MTIGFLINTCEPFYRGGYERRAWAFARELARQGHDVRVYTSCPRDEVIDGVKFVRVSAPRKFFNERGVRNIWADVFFTLNILRLFSKLRECELDVLDVCATPFLHLPIAAYLARKKDLPLSVTCHEALLASLPEYVKERGHRGKWRERIFTRLLTAIYRKGMEAEPEKIAVSYGTADAMEKEGYPAEGVVEFGLEPEAFSSQMPVERPAFLPVRFVFCGRLTPIKQVDQTIAALLSLRESGAAFHFDVIGGGSERAALEKQVETAKAEEAFTFHGELSEKEKRAILFASDVFVLSSPREGFSIATLEAMAQGCCAIVVNDPRRPSGALDFVQDREQGIVVEPGVQPLREAMERLLTKPEFLLRLRRAAWTTAHGYQIERQALRLEEFYIARAEL
jgi:glycosyltransferase involved in cell wall biosynthesis